MKEETSKISFSILDKNYELIMVLLENAVSLYIYEDTPKFGTFGISVPPTEFMSASTLYITGKKNEQYVRMIGERIATKIKKLVLISLSIDDIDNDVFLKILENIETELIKDTAQEEQEKEEV